MRRSLLTTHRYRFVCVPGCLSEHQHLSKHVKNTWLSVHIPLCLNTIPSVCRSVRVVKPYWMSCSFARRQTPTTQRPHQISLLPRMASWGFCTSSCRSISHPSLEHLLRGRETGGLTFVVLSGSPQGGGGLAAS